MAEEKNQDDLALEEQLIEENIVPVTKLDYKLESPQERNELVKKITMMGGAYSVDVSWTIDNLVGSTEGVKLIKLKDSQKVSSIALIKKEDENSSDIEFNEEEIQTNVEIN